MPRTFELDIKGTSYASREWGIQILHEPDSVVDDRGGGTQYADIKDGFRISSVNFPEVERGLNIINNRPDLTFFIWGSDRAKDHITFFLVGDELVALLKHVKTWCILNRYEFKINERIVMKCLQ